MLFKIKSILSVMFLLLINYWLTACATRPSSGDIVIPLQEYSIEDRENLANILDTVNNPILDKFIGDYKNLRDKVRVVNMELIVIK